MLLPQASALDIHDYQIQFITQKVNAKLEVILKSKEPIVALTMKIYDVIQADTCARLGLMMMMMVEMMMTMMMMVELMMTINLDSHFHVLTLN